MSRDSTYFMSNNWRQKHREEFNIDPIAYLLIVFSDLKIVV